MARMPQIPGIEYGERPDGRIERADLPDVGAAGAPLRDASSALDAVGNFAGKALAANEKARQDALDEKQKIVDEVTATRTAGDFEEALRNHADQIQTAFADKPGQAPEAFIKGAREQADQAISAAPNGAVSLALARKTASVIDAGAKDMHTWAQLRMTQQAKNDLTVMVNQATRGAEDQYSAAGLKSYADDQWDRLKASVTGLHADPDKTRDGLFGEIAKSWVTAASQRDPIGTMKALDAKDGYLVDHLTVEDRKSLRGQAEKSLEGLGKTKQATVLKEGIDQLGNLHDLLNDGKLTAGTVYGVKKALDLKRASIVVDPNMGPEARKAQLESVDLQSKTLGYLDEIVRKQAGFDAPDDEGVRARLLADHKALFTKGDESSDLSAVLKFRADLDQAFAKGKISKGTFTPLDRNMSLALPRSLATESKKTGWALPFGLWSWRNPREQGNQTLNDLTDGKTGLLGNLTDKQRNDARQFYIEQWNSALEQGQNVDAPTAQLMARRAAYLAAGRQMPAGGK